MPINQTNTSELLRSSLRPPDKKSRGKLRIYLGYAAGVGKTYAMLSDAQEARKSGIDVVAGYIEPHDRADTTAMLEELETLPPMELSYKGVLLREFDLDGALRRNPTLLLVDELAHTNADGCRHKKRYQDVEEALRAGIDVYTTVNVQHIESLHDLVAVITGISVRERIPDSVFDSADQVELVDIEPDDLIARLEKGKIYHDAQAKRALRHFFTKEKLTALREIALRRTAEQVKREAQVEATRNDTSENEKHAYGSEEILVCLSSAPSNARVIRAAARLAEALHGGLTALFVEMPDTFELKGVHLDQLRTNLRLAEQLGAKIATVYGEDVPVQIAEYAKTGRMTKIVMGRSVQRRFHFARTTYVDRLSSLAPNLDIFLIPDDQSNARTTKPPAASPFRFTVADTAKSVLGLAVCTLLGLWFHTLGMSEANVVTFYILGVLLNALITQGRLYSVMCSVFSVLLFNFFFIEPRFSMQSYDSGTFVTFGVMLAAALITSTLTKKIQRQARLSAQKAYRTDVLLETNRLLQQANDQPAILQQTAQQLNRLLGRTILVYAAEAETLANPVVFAANGVVEDQMQYCGIDERAVALWVYKNNKRAGAGTNTLCAAKCMYLAVRGSGGALAVIGIAMDNTPPLEAYEKSLLLAILGECSLAFEKEALAEAQKQSAVQVEQEKLRSNLLRGISHDLRTPLTSISGSADILMHSAEALSAEQRKKLSADIYDDAVWLSNLIENLLSITRIENGTLTLALQPELLREVVDEALQHVSRKSIEHHISTSIDNPLLMAKMEPRLIVQVVINLVNNAIQYTPQQSNIKISAYPDDGKVRIEVADDGLGIPDDSKARLFDLFYTGNESGANRHRGLGLGLYLCRAIVEAHGGEIYVRDNDPCGAVVGFTLQQETVHAYE